MKICIMVCANGLGHIRRVLAILNYLFYTKPDKVSHHTFKIYFPVERLNYLKNWDDYKFISTHKNVDFINYSYPINYKVDSLGDKLWYNINLEDFIECDFVWSDNITQVLDLNVKSIITGSFFWYEVLESLVDSDKVKRFAESQRNLLKEKKPIMIGNEYFSTADVRELTNFYPVGFYKYNISENSFSNKSDILLSAGLGGESVRDCSLAVQKIIDQNLKPPRTLWLEPKIYKKNFPEWIKPATYSSDMFNKCYVACIRPGIGTISDSLLGGNYIISFSDSPEMYHNSSIISKNEFGENSESPFEAYIRANEVFYDKRILDIARIKTAHLRSDGVSGSAEIIWELISNKK